MFIADDAPKDVMYGCFGFLPTPTQASYTHMRIMSLCSDAYGLGGIRHNVIFNLHTRNGGIIYPQGGFCKISPYLSAECQSCFCYISLNNFGFEHKWRHHYVYFRFFH